MALGSTQPLTEISIRGISWGKGGRYVWLTTLPASSAGCLEILGVSTCCRPKGLCRPVMGLLTFTFTWFLIPLVFNYPQISRRENMLKVFTTFCVMDVTGLFLCRTINQWRSYVLWRPGRVITVAVPDRNYALFLVVKGLAADATDAL
jgi:hypothetical protein